LVSLGAFQEIREATSLRRVNWAETQVALAAAVNPLLRNSDFRGTPWFIVEVDRVGRVVAGVLLESSGDFFLDSAAREGLESFQFAPPGESGLYRLAVPMTIDSLLPRDLTQRCLPAGAINDFVRESLGRGNQMPTVQVPGIPKSKPTYVVSFEHDLPPQSPCEPMMARWPDAESQAELADLPDVALCVRDICPTPEGDIARVILRITDIRMTWINEWTFNGGGTGPWVVRCTSDMDCTPVRRPRFPIGAPAI